MAGWYAESSGQPSCAPQAACEPQDQPSNQIKSNQIRSDQIRSDQIKSNQIKSNQIKSDQIKSNQIKSDQIRSDQIKSNQIKSNQIKSNQIKSNQIKSYSSATPSFSLPANLMPHPPQVAQALRGISEQAADMPDWKKQSFGSHPTFGKITKLSITQQREGLPIYKLKNELLDAIADNQILVVIGETGSGKTTQVQSAGALLLL